MHMATDSRHEIRSQRTDSRLRLARPIATRRPPIRIPSNPASLRISPPGLYHPGITNSISTPRDSLPTIEGVIGRNVFSREYRTDEPWDAGWAGLEIWANPARCGTWVADWGLGLGGEWGVVNDDAAGSGGSCCGCSLPVLCTEVLWDAWLAPGSSCYATRRARSLGYYSNDQ